MTDPDSDAISGALIQDVCERLAAGRSIRQSLPGNGTLNIDRLLPFLCVYRRHPARTDTGTGLFATAEGAYLLAPGGAARRKGLRQLIGRIAETAAGQLNGFLLLEIWTAEDSQVPQDQDPETGEPLFPRPRFRILARPHHHLEKTIAELEYALQRIKVHRQAATVEVEELARNHPPHMTPLIAPEMASRLHCDVLGVEILPVFRHPKSGELYGELFLAGLRRGVGRALKKAFFTYALNHTVARPQHYWVMGRRTMSQQVWGVDRRLAEISGQFKFLLACTPVNAQRAWHTFSESNYTREPQFAYRPLATDPLLLKRRLLQVPTEQIEDPTLANLFRQAQYELDRQLTMLSDIGTRRFLPGSQQVFGVVEPPLLQLAEEILRKHARRTDEVSQVTAKEFARRAQREIQFYRRQMKSMAARAVIRDDMYTGLLSTGGNLFIGRETSLDRHRVDALLHHEIGTHLLTYYNGQAQPLRLLKVGLAGYDALQEGMAVLSEYLVGGLGVGRIRTLAVRVVAVEKLLRGVPFADSYRTLVQDYGFDGRVAFTILVRVYRGGGLTKDAVYLRGLVEILEYLARGGDLELLFVGKLAADHIPVIRELLLRGVLRAPVLRPRYLDDPIARERLTRVRGGLSVLDLLDS